MKYSWIKELSLGRWPSQESDCQIDIKRDDCFIYMRAAKGTGYKKWFAEITIDNDRICTYQSERNFKSCEAAKKHCEVMLPVLLVSNFKKLDEEIKDYKEKIKEKSRLKRYILNALSL